MDPVPETLDPVVCGLRIHLSWLVVEYVKTVISALTELDMSPYV